ncbi:MAG TPA: TolC family protein [Terriglobales bacterium]
MGLTMRAAHQAVTAVLGAVALSGCAVQHLPPRPLRPAAGEAALTARRLDDAGLLTFLRANHVLTASAALPTAWTLPMLADAALYFSPAMDAARAQLAAAQAGELTAASRPNPTISLQPGVPNPYLFNLDWSVPILTAGKRGWQMRQAAALTAASRLGLARTAWQVRSAVRGALVNDWAVRADQRQLQAQQRVEAQRVRLLSQQLAAGEITRPELDTARIALATTRQALLHDQTTAMTTSAALAAAIGVPAAALTGIRIAWPAWETPPAPASLSAARMQREAMINNLDVRQALANYQAAEANLQLELARQYPDIQLGPGYAYEESKSYFTVGLAVTLPIFNHNQGPIAAAAAQRQQAAATVTAAQAQVMAASDAAWAAYRGAYAEWQAARALTQLQQGQTSLAAASLQAGETASLALNSAQLDTALASTAAAAALARAQAALGNLEQAVERPLATGDPAPLAPDAPALQGHRPAHRQGTP